MAHTLHTRSYSSAGRALPLATSSARLFASVLALGSFACSETGDIDNNAAEQGLVSAPDICETALFCDEFESYELDAIPRAPQWTTKTVSGSVVFDGTRSYSGTKSVKSTTLEAEDYKTALLGFRDPSVLPTASNAHFGRMMFFLESAPTDTIHWTFVDALGQAPGNDEFPNGYEAVYRYGGQRPVPGGSQLMASYETPGFYSTPATGPDTDCHQDSTAVPMPEAKWACAEWMFDGANNEMQLWIDGVEVNGLHVVGNGTRCRTLPDETPWTAPIFSQIDLGWESYQTDVERSIWIDDFIVDSQRIGCPAPPL